MRYFKHSFYYCIVFVCFVIVYYFIIITQENLRTEQYEAEISSLKVKQLENKKYSILEKIALCESGNRQFDADGNIVRGKLNPNDIGKYQISIHYWQLKANELGFDIFTEEGNEKMARWIFDHYGTSPWNWSKNCWNK